MHNISLPFMEGQVLFQFVLVLINTFIFSSFDYDIMFLISYSYVLQREMFGPFNLLIF